MAQVSDFYEQISQVASTPIYCTIFYFYSLRNRRASNYLQEDQRDRQTRAAGSSSQRRAVCLFCVVYLTNRRRLQMLQASKGGKRRSQEAVHQSARLPHQQAIDARSRGRGLSSPDLGGMESLSRQKNRHEQGRQGCHPTYAPDKVGPGCPVYL